MSTLYAIENEQKESLTEASARRLRGALAEHRLTGRDLQRRLGVSYTWVSRRLNGKVAMSTDDLEMIEGVTGISAVYLVSGIKNNRRQDIAGDGFSVHPPGLEPGTHWLSVWDSENEGVEGAKIIDLTKRLPSEMADADTTVGAFA